MLESGHIPTEVVDLRGLRVLQHWDSDHVPAEMQAPCGVVPKGVLRKGAFVAKCR